EQLTPTALGYLQQQDDYVRRLGFCRKSGSPKRKRRTSFPVRFRLSFKVRSLLHCSAVTNSEQQFSITNPQQLLPLAKVALETKALGDSKARNEASLDPACLP